MLAGDHPSADFAISEQARFRRFVHFPMGMEIVTIRLPPEVQKALPGSAEARAIMQKLGYGPDKRLALNVSTRNMPPFRDPAVILIDQLKEVFIDGDLEIVETALWYHRMYRKDFKIGLNLTGGGVDDPDQQFYENYGCGSPHNAEVEELTGASGYLSNPRNCWGFG
jgi:ABC-type transport system substrate-binding protein